jgi:hypothetical protein
MDDQKKGDFVEGAVMLTKPHTEQSLKSALEKMLSAA